MRPPIHRAQVMYNAHRITWTDIKCADTLDLVTRARIGCPLLASGLMQVVARIPLGGETICAKGNNARGHPELC